MDNNIVLRNCLLSNFCNLLPVRLDDSNYVPWKFLLETMLKGCGLLKYIDGSFPCPPRHIIREEDGITSDMIKEYENWEQNDSAVMSLLAATLSSDVLSFIIGSKTSREIWCQLKEKYANTSRSNILHLKTSLYNIQKGTDSIDKYLLRVKLICDQLATVGVYMADEDILLSVLHGLPSAYGTIKTIIRIKQSPVSMQELRSLLLIAEDEIEQSSLPSKTAMAAYGVASRNKDDGVVGHSGYTYGGGFDSRNKGFSSIPIDVKPYSAPSSIPVLYGFQDESKKIVVPNGMVGNIIGTQDETIKYLQAQSGGAKIQVTRDTGADPIFPTREVEIMGTANANHLINEVLAEVELQGPTIVSGRLTGQAKSEQFVMKIPNNKVGLVIGKRGATIKNMQASTAASIQVIPLHLPPGDTSTERIVQIDGTSEQIEVAKQLVNKVISENRVRNPAMAGGYSQQGYQARPPIGWAPGGPPIQQPGYGYGQSGATSQYNVSQPSNPIQQQQQNPGGIVAPSDNASQPPSQSKITTPLSAAPQLSISTQSPLLSSTHSMMSTSIGISGISDHNGFVSATPVPSDLLDWQQTILKEIDTLVTQGPCQLSSSSSDSTLLHCRQASRSMELWKSMPMIPSG